MEIFYTIIILCGNCYYYYLNFLEEIKTEIFNKNNFILSAFQNIEDDGLQNLYELYSSPIIENFNNW